MSDVVTTVLGRVQPNYRGTYSGGTVYNKLDYVDYNGSSYICRINGVSSILPTNTGYWQLVASKGDQGIQGYTGSFGTTDGSVTMHSADEPAATVTVTTDGPDTAKNFHFAFDLPRGPIGYDDVAASATSLAAGSVATASAELITEDNVTTLSFEFGIPAADGEGIRSIDTDVTADQSGNAALTAVRYGTSQNLTDPQKSIARQNIGAQVSGNYIVEPEASVGQFLRYGNTGDWIGATINLVPTGSAADVGRYLRKSSNGMIWSDVQSLPSGGVEGVPLIKNSIDDYDVTWGSFISTSEIDEIIEV